MDHWQKQLIESAYDRLDRATVQFHPVDNSRGMDMKQAALDAMSELEKVIFDQYPPNSRKR